MLIRADRRQRRGVAMVEGSIGLVFLLFVIFAIMEFGLAIMARQLLNNAARTAARAAASGRQPATYSDGTPTPSPGSPVTTAFLNTWITKALAVAPVTGVNPRYYGSNPDGTPNTSVTWNATGFGNGFFVDVKATYVPLFSGGGISVTKNAPAAPIVGAINLRSLVYLRAEANN